ncbi:MAG TPA: hypothetical protein VME22_16130, partial [Solirubrobacteraceae bacterium]|nr:hypothetical protein [Solirubrobacteraceae bacterium]
MPLRARAREGGPREVLLSAPVTGALAAVLAAVFAIVLYKVGNPQHQLKVGLGVVAAIVVVLAATRPVFALGLVFGLLPFEYRVYGIGTDEALIFTVGLVLAHRIQRRRLPMWIFLAGAA